MPYEANWESLSAYPVPEWFKDAKFGIFIHWGVYSVPAYRNEWYPRNMYRRDQPEFTHHAETWGEHAQFGYKDFVPMFRAQAWDPAAWVQLFQRAGARYIVPVGEHHDGFPMYACTRTPWNAFRMGPQRDVVAELEQEVRGAGLKFGVSSHRAFNWRYYTFEDDFDTVDPANAALYGPAHAPDAPHTQAFLDDWWARTTEMVEKFEPDVFWFDFGWHHDDFTDLRPKLAAYYYNRMEEWGRQGVLQYKDTFPDGVAVLDIERGKLDDIRPHYWQTDTSVSKRSWCYIQDDEFKSVTALVHDLVDIVSKNGNLLLNIGPRPDGTIPDEAAACLLGVGAWLDLNGEAIYETRHWERFGEGPTGNVVGHLSEQNNTAYTPQDIRYTRKGNTLYAILLGWPGEQARLTALGSGSSVPSDRILGIEMLGHPGKLRWRQDAAGLHVMLPEAPPCEHAQVLKLTLE
jgi:alpha-L-fucosidase